MLLYLRRWTLGRLLLMRVVVVLHVDPVSKDEVEGMTFEPGETNNGRREYLMQERRVEGQMRPSVFRYVSTQR